MLNTRLTLHDIHDIEAFTARLLPAGLNPTEHEDLHAHLIAEAWILSTRYHPGGIAFSTLAGHTLRQRAHDWKRARGGRTTWQFANRTHTRELPTLISTDEHPHALTEASRDPSTDSPPTLDRLLRTRGSSEAWDHHTRRPRMPRRAA